MQRGCITSAETVMLEKQSLDEFLSHMNTEAVIVSLSPQSRASLAAYFDLSPAQVFRKLTAFFKSLGVKAVYDTSCSRDLSLIESCNEFISRYRKHYLAGNKENASELPMIASACPGWICYVEKTLGSFILPYISSVKSPQQAMGAVIKHHISKKIGFSPEKIFHVTVMPCYDKKLEAARDDFVFSVDHGAENDQINDDSDAKIIEVDIVLTSEESLDLIQSKSIDFKALEEAPLDRLLMIFLQNSMLLFLYWWSREEDSPASLFRSQLSCATKIYGSFQGPHCLWLWKCGLEGEDGELKAEAREVAYA